MILIFHNRNQTHWIVLGMMIWPCLCHANVRHSLFSRMWHADCTNTNWNIQQSSPLKMSTIQLIIRVFLFTQITSRTGTGNSGRISEWIHFNSKFPSAWSELVVSSSSSVRTKCFTYSVPTWANWHVVEFTKCWCSNGGKLWRSKGVLRLILLRGVHLQNQVPHNPQLT